MNTIRFQVLFAIIVVLLAMTDMTAGAKKKDQVATTTKKFVLDGGLRRNLRASNHVARRAEHEGM